MNYKRLYLDSPYLDVRTEGDAGFDIRAYGEYILKPGTLTSVSTGIAVAIPKGWVGLVTGRSGLRSRHRINQRIGVIDSGYRGEIILHLENDSEIDFYIQDRDRVAQMVVVPYWKEEAQEVDDLDSTLRGSNAFGSTGIGERLQWL